MSDCVHCGRPAPLGSDEHDDCSELAVRDELAIREAALAAGYTEADIVDETGEPIEPA